MTEKQVIEIQDRVDRAICDMLRIVTGRDIDWNEEIAREIRDDILDLVADYYAMNVDDLYPPFEDDGWVEGQEEH